MKELQERAIKAAKRFIERRGMEIVDGDPVEIDNGFVAREDDTMVFVEVSATSSVERGLPSQKTGEDARRRRERQAAAWLARFSEGDLRVRFDSIALLVLGGDRALLRHHINCLAGE